MERLRVVDTIYLFLVKINQLENTKFSVDFYLEDQNSIPTIKKMGMLNDIYIEENGGWKIFS